MIGFCDFGDGGGRPMVQAKDIMTKRLMTIRPQAKIIEVIKLMVDHRVTGLPVVNDDMDLLGMVTEKDILKILLYEKDIKSRTASDLMTTEITSFNEDENLMPILKSLVENNFRRVPILSDEKLVGIISRRDIMNFLSEKVGEFKKS
jgi:CBS domain-containing protein